MIKSAELENSAYEFEAKMPLRHAVPLGLQHVFAMFVGNLTPLLIIKFALTIIWLIGFEWVFALQARFENTVAGTLKNAFIFGISHISMTAALVVVDAVFVALLAGSWFYMPGGLFPLVILGYGTMLMLHIPVTERVFKPYLQQ